jgi:hypothetical protein
VFLLLSYSVKFRVLPWLIFCLFSFFFSVALVMSFLLPVFSVALLLPFSLAKLPFLLLFSGNNISS